MKKRMLISSIGLLVFAILAGCVSTPQKQVARDMKALSFANQANGELELVNMTGYELVIFAGNIDRKNILGGIHAGNTRSFDFRPYVSSQSGAFLCRAVNKAVYEEKGGKLSERDVLWAKLVVFGDKKSSFTIVGEVGGDGKLLFENASPYPVEIRLNGTTGEVFKTLTHYCKEQYVYVTPNDRGYAYFPTYLVYDKTTGKVNSVTVNEDDGQSARPVEGSKTPQTITFPNPNSKLYGAKVAYLTVKNESGKAFIFRNDNTEVSSQNGYKMINSGETLTFELDATEAGKTYRSLNADFRFGSQNKRYVKLFNGEPTLFKAGVEYEISVYNENGTIKTEIESSTERDIKYDLKNQLDLE